VLKQSSAKCSEHSMWCSVGIKSFLLALINHCFSSAGFFNGNLWKLSLCSDSDWPTDRLLQPTAAQRLGVVILNTYYSINNFEKITTMLMNSHHYTKTNIHNTLYSKQPCPEMTSSGHASRFVQTGRKMAQTSFFANMAATMAQKFD